MSLDVPGLQLHLLLGLLQELNGPGDDAKMPRDLSQAALQVQAQIHWKAATIKAGFLGWNHVPYFFWEPK